MKNRKAFTLIELLGTIAIIGILTAVAVFSYIYYLNAIRTKTFKIEEVNFVDATKGAYNDCYSSNTKNDFCKNHKEFDSKYKYEIVYLKELINDSYINEIKNPYDDSKFCNSEKSYVYASKKDTYQDVNSDIVYKVCLICGNHQSEECLDEKIDYSSFDTTCTAYYDAIGGSIYDGKWTDRNVYLSFGASGNFRYGIDEFEYTINNSNNNRIDANSNYTASITLNKTASQQEYKVQAFDGMNGKGTLVSCGASIKIDKAPINSVNISGKTVDGGDVSSNVWTSKQTILSANADPVTSTSGYLYQWYLDGNKYGNQTTSNSLVVSEKGTFKVDITNRVGKITKTSGDFIAKVDMINPTCSIKVTSGTEGSNGWYTSNVTVDWDSKDGTGSEIVYANINQTLVTTNGVTTVTATVTDEAGNIGTCTKDIKIDKITPGAPTITASDNKGSNTWHNSDFTLNYSGASNKSGNTYYYGTNTNPTTSGTSTPINTNTTGTTYYVKVCSGAGLCSTNNSYVVKLDKTTPGIPTIAASDNKGTNTWHNSDFTLSYSGASNISGNTYYYGTNTNPTTSGTSTLINTNTTGTTYYVKVCSGAGLCSTNNNYVAKLDKTTPTITAKNNNTYIRYGTNSSPVDYFNITYGVSSGSTTCTVTNVNQLALGVNNVTCTATSTSGLSSSASTTFKHQYSATLACRDGRTLSGGNCIYTYTNNEAKCGCQTYNSCANSACGVNQYKSCQNSACGSTTNTCRTSACGVESYKSCATSGCGCAEYKCTLYKSCLKCTCSVWPDPSYNCNPPYYDKDCGDPLTNGGGKATFTTGRYPGCGTETVTGSACNGVSGATCNKYNSCANSACGVNQYKSCQNSACGSTTNTCRTSACGVESYKSCATSACGCQTGNSCTKTENEYQYYYCASTGNNGTNGTLNNTTCSF